MESLIIISIDKYSSSFIDHQPPTASIHRKTESFIIKSTIASKPHAFFSLCFLQVVHPTGIIICIHSSPFSADLSFVLVHFWRICPIYSFTFAFGRPLFLYICYIADSFDSRRLDVFLLHFHRRISMYRTYYVICINQEHFLQITSLLILAQWQHRVQSRKSDSEPVSCAILEISLIFTWTLNLKIIVITSTFVHSIPSQFPTKSQPHHNLRPLALIFSFNLCNKLHLFSFSGLGSSSCFNSRAWAWAWSASGSPGWAVYRQRKWLAVSSTTKKQWNLRRRCSIISI